MVSKLSLHFFETFVLFLVLQPFIVNSFNLESLQNIERIKNEKNIKRLNQVKQYLKYYGYYPHDVKFTLDARFDDSLESALKTYQKFYYLNVTGKIDSDTIEAMMTPRCGHPDIIRDSAPTGGPSNDNHSIFSLVSQDAQRRWRTYKLTYIIKNDDNVFTKDEMSPSVTQAFNSWADVSPFNFTKVGGLKNTNIKIGFFPKDHGDKYPFQKLEFAHAFPPPSGKLHLNAAWNWTFNPTESDEVDVESILVHELGHVLGLSHSQNESAVMYAYFTPGTTKRKLTKDDIDSIKALYPKQKPLHE